MPPIVALDCETWLIEPGLAAPPLICVQWRGNAFEYNRPAILHRDRAKEVVEAFLRGNCILVGHNVAYDMAVICAQWPDLIPLVFDKYDRNQVTDTMIRDQLIQVAEGEFRSWVTRDGEIMPVNYTLADCTRRRLQRNLKKEGFRMFYRIFDAVPNIDDWDKVAAGFQRHVRDGFRPPWFAEGGVDDDDIAGLLAADPSEARTYALEDGNTTLDLYEAQEHWVKLFDDQYRQARAAFALRLITCWGFYTDTESVDKLEAALNGELDDLKDTLIAAGLIRSNGTADTKAAMAAMEEACREENIPVGRTKGGKVSLSAESCARFDDDSIIGQYSRFLTVRKTLTNDIKMLRAGCDVPVQSQYGTTDSFRTRATKPNVQAINRGAGIREAFRPRPGFVFIQSDFEMEELHTLAQWCLVHLGKSELAKALNAGKDVHTMMACSLLKIPYEEGMARKKAGDKVLKEYRQRAKPINFGYPGGLGIQKFRRFAKLQYNVDMTDDEARMAKELWLQMWPEMLDFFQMAAQATANPAGVGDEWSLYSNRLHGNNRYSVVCNGRFQRLAADASKAALWAVTRAQFTQPESPLYGTRSVAFIHDEIIAECEEGPRMSAAARELGRVMCEAGSVFTPDVPLRAVPLIMRVWSKNAEPVYDEEGNLIPWEPKLEAA